MTVDPTVVIAAIGALAGGVGWFVKHLVADRDYWRSIALKMLGHNERVITTQEKALTIVESVVPEPDQSRGG